jgi:hypothetical protein
MAGLIRMIVIGEIGPGRTSSQHPQNAVQDGATGFPRSAAVIFRSSGAGMSGSRIAHWASVRSRG